MHNLTRNVVALIVGLAALAGLGYGLTRLLNPTGGSVPFTPYLLVLVSIAAVVGCTFVILRSLGWHAVPEPKGVEGGMFELRPKSSRRDWAVLGTVVAGVWNLVNGPAALHYFTYERTQQSLGGTIVVLLFVAVSVAVAGVALWNLTSLLRVEDAQLFLTGRRVYVGQDLSIRLIQKCAADVHVDRVRVGLVCLPSGGRERPTGGAGKTAGKPGGRPTGTGTKAVPVFESWKESYMDRDVKKGERLRVEHTITVPRTAPPSHPGGGKHYDWSVWLVTKLAQGADYRAEFPLKVEVKREGAEDREVKDLISRYSTAKKSKA